MNLDSQRVTLLVLLDLSAAFDTVDHGVLLNRLSTSFGIRGSALQWFASYLLNRSQRVSFDQNLSDKFNLHCGVPQGSCLGPLLFTIYASIAGYETRQTSKEQTKMPRFMLQGPRPCTIFCFAFIHYT